MWWYVDCLHRYARLMERQGQPLLCMAHLSKASAVCEAVDERRHKRRLDRLRWRVRVQLGWQLERLDGSGVQQQTAEQEKEKEKYEVAAEEAMQSMEAALEDEQRTGTDRLMQARLHAELADVYMRRGQLHTASERYQCALAAVSQAANKQQSTVSAPRHTDTGKRKVRTVGTARTTTKPQTADQHREAEPIHDRTTLLHATWQAKLASITLSPLTTPRRSPHPDAVTSSTLSAAVAALLRSSATFQQQQRQVELAWSTYMAGGGSAQ